MKVKIDGKTYSVPKKVAQRQTTFDVLDVSDIIGPIPELKWPDFIQKVLSKYPSANFAEAWFGVDYDYENTDYFFKFPRLETDAEFNQRIKNYSASSTAKKMRKRIEMQSEIKELKRLQKKYGKFP